MRCPYCNTLIIHKFNGNYNRMDKKRKRKHIRNCKYNPDNVFRNLKSAQISANLLFRYTRMRLNNE